jgi:NADH dehydrogenase/NADH:ubiquinone oxidoreductase subunit G
VQPLDRRDCMKQMLMCLAAVAPGAVAVPALGQEKQAKSSTGADDFWKRVDEAKARPLVQSAVKAARAQVQAQRAINASKRAAILVGEEAGKEHLTRAKAQYEVRTAELRKVKGALAQFVKGAGDSGNARFKEFVGKGALKELATHARESSIRALMNSDISPAEAQSALKALEDRLGKIQGIDSFGDLTSYLDKHLDELMERKMPEEDPNGFCVFILIITSIFAVLVVIAVLLCIFTLGLGCQGILDSLIAQACP